MQHRKIVLHIFGATIFSWYYWFCIINPTTWHLVDTINLVFHEAGHAICIFFPSLITALAGSTFQILIPTVCAIYFYRRREVVSGHLLLLWVAQNMVSVSIYIRDAVPMQLPLLGGDSSIHDWNFILGQLGILTWSATLANLLLAAAYLTALTATFRTIRYFVLQYKTATIEKVRP